MKDSPYFGQVELLLRCLPEVGRENCFSLKGGTAINLFVRDLPRLSVDIDLAYLPTEPWETAIKNVDSSLKTIAANILKSIKGSKVNTTKDAKTGQVIKLVVSLDGSQIKIEPNPVIRGSVYASKDLPLVKTAVKEFGMEVETSVVSMADLYGGKLVAALDRQHPRDLFDTKLLLENEGITNEIRLAFVVYLASHARPMHEVIKPTLHDKKTEFEKEFEGMTSIPFSYADFEQTRKTLIEQLNREMTASERAFLISLQEGSPDWSKLGIEGIEDLPALKWKVMNVQKMEKGKREMAVQDLKQKLNV